MGVLMRYNLLNYPILTFPCRGKELCVQLLSRNWKPIIQNKMTHSLNPQPLHHPTVDQMLLDNLIDIRLAFVCVPHALRINHQYRTLRAAIHAACIVHAHLTRTRDFQFLGARLGVIAHRLGIVILATRTAAFALIGAEKHVVLVVRHNEAPDEYGVE